MDTSTGNDNGAAHGVTLRPVTAANWRATLELGVRPEQQRFIADYAPIAAIALAKAFVRPGGLQWEPFAIADGDDLVGLIELAYTPHSADQYWIYHFFIDERYQGRGYGRAALRAFVELVRANHPACQRIQLQVHPENERAQRLYEHVGFVATGATIDDEPVYALPVHELYAR